MSVELAWEQFGKLKSASALENSVKDEHPEHRICKNCGSTDFVNDSEVAESTCNACGLVIINSDIPQEEFSGHKSKLDACTFITVKAGPRDENSKKLQRLQGWYMWTNKEKNAYKLTGYTKELCYKLGIIESLYSTICEMAVAVMEAVRSHEGTKRGRVKDGIVVACINYIYKERGLTFNIPHMAKRIDLDIKYVTKGEKLMLELINLKKLNINKQIVLATDSPFDYVLDITRKKGLHIPVRLLEETQKLIGLCELNNILLDHTPLSIGVSCFFYIIKLHNVPIDVKMIADFYGISTVTILKTYSKLNCHKDLAFKLH